MKTSRLLLKIIAVWIILMAVESVHGTLRILFLVPRIGELPAKQISFLPGLALILFITYLFIPWIGAKTTRPLIITGVIWVVLTFIFEIGLGRLVFNYSWDKVFADYDLFNGGLMLIGLLILVIAPWSMAKLQRIV
ncbi:MAG: hypothetical protein ABIG31_02560 [Candidatus Omnitrophota bacterium]